MRAVGDVVGVLLVNRIIIKANRSATIDAKLRGLPAVQGKQMAARVDGQAVHTLLIGKPNFQRLVFFAKKNKPLNSCGKAENGLNWLPLS